MTLDQEQQLALGRYIEAEDKLKHAFTQRRNMATDLDGLLRRVTMSQNISGGVVQSLNVNRAQEILNRLSQQEEEIAAALNVMNENAPKCGKPVMKLSD
jgi:ABC-type methionine transport system ATPase subunit